MRLDLSLVPSEYNFILILSQVETERFLEDQLARHAVAVERQREAIAVADQGSHVVARIRHASGNVEEVVADYVVGCDGAHSVVRHSMNIPYAGSTYEGDFVLGDVALSWPWPSGGIRVFLSDLGALACFPMKGQAGLHRLILVNTTAIDPSAFTATSESDVSPEAFRQLVDSLAPEPIEIRDFKWLTRFRLHHRIAQHFRVGRAFLAGDAAHIHSPVGGQGMNTGIQDALNLGSKLATVLRGRSDASLLDQYEKERIPVAREVLRGTDLGFKLVLASNRGALHWIRSHVIAHVIARRWVQRIMTRTVSQVDVARREMRERAAAAN